MNDASEHEKSYDDVPYVSYEFPLMYRRSVVEGEPFVYYRGRKRRSGGRQPQVYLGAGTVGGVSESSREGRLVCQVVDGREFLHPVPFKDATGTPLEIGGIRRGYYQRGVRTLTPIEYRRILGLGELPNPEELQTTTQRPGEAYAAAATARAVEDYSRTVVADTLRGEHPHATILSMAFNNPGFDLRTNIRGLQFVEVKGTQAPIPRFFMTERERLFAERYAPDYLLAVVYGIDLKARRHAAIEWRPGGLVTGDTLEPQQWSGRLSVGTPQ